MPAIGGGFGGGGAPIVPRRRRTPPPSSTFHPGSNTSAPVIIPSPTSSPSPRIYPVPQTVPLSNLVTQQQRIQSMLPSFQARRPRPQRGPRANAPQPRVQKIIDQLSAPGVDDPALEAAIRRMAPKAVEASQKTGIPASVLLAVNGQETAYSTNRNTSSAGARGAGQFIASTGATYAAKGYKPFNYGEKGLEATGAYLRDLMKGNGGDLNAALSSYSGGYSAGSYNNPILSRARSFQQQGLDKIGGNAARTVRAPRDRRLSTSELFYDPGINLSDNQPTSPIGGHDTHVHFGSTDPRSLLRAATIAQRKGATIAENPAYDTVDPVHAGTTSASGGPRGLPTGDSMHYQYQRIPRGLMDSRLYRKSGAQGRLLGGALDIQGDPATLDAVDRALARRSGAPVGGAPAAFSGGGGGFAGGAPSGLPSPGAPSTGRPPRTSALRDILSGRGGGGGGAPLSNAIAARAPSPTLRPDEPTDEETLSDLLALYGRLQYGY